ncbi:MAG: hypothetical protein OXG30_00400 [bacterium]|nr:hypothetical protein [bacterium]
MPSAILDAGGVVALDSMPVAWWAKADQPGVVGIQARCRWRGAPGLDAGGQGRSRRPPSISPACRPWS